MNSDANIAGHLSLDLGAQPALHFGGGNFHEFLHRVYSTVIQVFRKRSQIKFSSQHYENENFLLLIRPEPGCAGMGAILL